MKYLALVLAVLLVGCTNTQRVVESEATLQQEELPSIDDFGAELAAQLGQYVRTFKPNSTIAVMSFLKADDFNEVTQDQGAGLSLALQESLITHLTQMGAEVVEYRLRNSLSLRNSADSMLSRELKTLNQRQKIDLAVVGTVVESRDRFMVNARLVDTLHNKAISAASIAIPKSAMWGKERVSTRDGRLIRSQY
ncbi:FlgO family outer membrane protein [Pseudoalteromonas sp. T1lg65]|uniref:FlgO family outer membrane protein n=1 Tax=Pseudoalteromonas sp. T1lg65 TaxID=2077101 RepID=UPI003F7AD317